MRATKSLACTSRCRRTPRLAAIQAGVAARCLMPVMPARSADILGIPFYVWDMAEEFSDGVLDDFVAGIWQGERRIPACAATRRSSSRPSWNVPWIWASMQCAPATTHESRRVPQASGNCTVRPIPDKDQSYVLGVLTAQQLAHSMFPLGDSLKSDVRADASERGLLVANKPDSYDICFIPDGDTAGWLRNRIGAEPGEIVDALSGKHLGNHEGAYAYTIGQRKGLGIKVA